MINHFNSAFIDSSIGTAGPLFPHAPSLVITLGVLCSVALPAALRLVLVPPRHETFGRFDDSPIPLPTLLSRAVTPSLLLNTEGNM